MIAPWMLKNWIIVQNPIAPFGNAIFRNPYFHPIYETGTRDALADYGVADKRALPLEVTIRGQKTQGLLGITFLLAPIALLALRFREGRRLLAAGAAAGPALLRQHRDPLPDSAAAVCLPGDGSGDRAAPPSAGRADDLSTPSFPGRPKSIATEAGTPGSWTIPVHAGAAAGPAGPVLREKSQEYGAARLVEATVPEGERILGTSGVPYAYCNRDLLVSYQGSAQPDPARLAAHRLDARLPARRCRTWFEFPEHTARRFRVVQTGTAEARARRSGACTRCASCISGVELPRQAEWRLRAWPNPWEVQLAFDNSLPTRWRTWETDPRRAIISTSISAADETVDEIRLETSPDYFVRQLQVEALDSRAANGWCWPKTPKPTPSTCLTTAFASPRRMS